jgi:hypothetical protein
MKGLSDIAQDGLGVIEVRRRNAARRRKEEYEGTAQFFLFNGSCDGVGHKSSCKRVPTTIAELLNGAYMN